MAKKSYQAFPVQPAPVGVDRLSEVLPGQTIIIIIILPGQIVIIIITIIFIIIIILPGQIIKLNSASVVFQHTGFLSP